MLDNNTDRKGGWLQTYTGRQFWPLDPHPEDIDIRDVAHALSNNCRYNGHCKEFYSVAQHSVLVASVLPDHLKLWGLLHDASEAYLSDVPRPIKPFLIGYKEMEARVMLSVCERFGLDPEMPAEVKQVDTAILADEKAALMAMEPAAWQLSEPPLNISIVGWRPEAAERLFLSTFHSLTDNAFQA